MQGRRGKKKKCEVWKGVSQFRGCGTNENEREGIKPREREKMKRESREQESERTSITINIDAQITERAGQDPFFEVPQLRNDSEFTINILNPLDHVLVT